MDIMIDQLLSQQLQFLIKPLGRAVSAWRRLWTATAFVTALCLQLIFYSYGFIITKEEFNDAINCSTSKTLPSDV